MRLPNPGPKERSASKGRALFVAAWVADSAHCLGGGPAGDSLADVESQAATLTARAGNQDPNHVHVELIERNPFQPRKDFDPESLNELIESIRQHGVLQPLLVRPAGTQYQLIAGERRLLAARQAGLETVPCRVLELEDRAMCEAALEENLKRRDLNVLEKAQAFQDYMNRFGASLDDLARQLSMSRSSVCNFLRLLELSEFVKEALLADRVTSGHARAILSLSPDDQVALCRRIEAESLSVRQTESAVRELLKNQQDGAARRFPSPPRRAGPPNRRLPTRPITSARFRSSCSSSSASVWRSSSRGRKKAKSSSPSPTTTISSGSCDCCRAA